MKSWIAGSLLVAMSLTVLADADEGTRAAEAALERDRARAAAGDRAREEARARERIEMEAGAKAGMAGDFRRSLGKEADGKSDDEVIRLYREKENAAGRN